MRHLKNLLERYWEWLNDSGNYNEASGRLWVMGVPLILLLALLMIWLLQ